MKDSPIYTIKLPPQPYKFLEGVGFVSENEELGRSGFESLKISAHADGGPRSPSAHAGPFARHPISSQKSYLKFQNPRTKT